MQEEKNEMNDYVSILNLTFEIEGLIVLLQQRDDESTKEIRTLLTKKVAQLEAALSPDAPVQETSVNEVPVQETHAVPEEDAELTEISEMPEIQAELPTFTLNDKFRFRRELFGNNEAEFNDTLKILSAMTSLSEAEDYLYNDLCWDASDENVTDFMAVLADYFKS